MPISEKIEDSIAQGARGVYDLGKVKIEFSVVFDSWSVSYQMLLIGIKNIVPSRSYRILKIQVITNYSMCANFKTLNTIPKNGQFFQFKNLSSTNFVIDL